LEGCQIEWGSGNRLYFKPQRLKHYKKDLNEPFDTIIMALSLGEAILTHPSMAVLVFVIVVVVAIIVTMIKDIVSDSV
jgi:hypothetical protein